MIIWHETFRINYQHCVHYLQQHPKSSAASKMHAQTYVVKSRSHLLFICRGSSIPTITVSQVTSNTFFWNTVASDCIGIVLRHNTQSTASTKAPILHSVSAEMWILLTASRWPAGLPRVTPWRLSGITTSITYQTFQRRRKDWPIQEEKDWYSMELPTGFMKVRPNCRFSPHPAPLW